MALDQVQATRQDKAIAPSKLHLKLAVLAVALVGAFALMLVPSDALSVQGKLSIIVFGAAVLAWSLTTLDSTYVALIAALAPVLAGQMPADALFATLSDPMIWLLMSAFIIAAAFTGSGLAGRMTRALLKGNMTLARMFPRIVLAGLVSALVIPSTSGRAALFLPIFQALKEGVSAKAAKALSLLIPVTILLSAAASLIGAGAHLVMVELVAGMGGARISYLQWLILGAPFALASCALSALVILYLFTDSDIRQTPFEVTPILDEKRSLCGAERVVLFTVIALVTLWISEPLHGLPTALIALCGAALVTAPKIGVLPLKKALGEVNWALLLFMAATLHMGATLVESGAAAWIVAVPFATMSGHAIALIAMVIAVSLMAHLVITSRTARATVLVPIILLAATPAGLNPAALAFLSTIAAGYCLTLPVSAKPLVLFSQLDGATFSQADLLRLGLWLIPLHLVLLTLFAFFVWPALGLDLFGPARITGAN
ncbi:SLC13 family permease [Thalassococcus sp. S3]|uniref:SLC13 family permease n=1 Tax=Thalassococcus sp. S3 TaxID=2017482 RepID=UPI001023F439|nr:SLC13 family permease [Thalassococcus sp. S3]QBF31107.1 transporter [Thalassococcus sp. S3]